MSRRKRPRAVMRWTSPASMRFHSAAGMMRGTKSKGQTRSIPSFSPYTVNRCPDPANAVPDEGTGRAGIFRGLFSLGLHHRGVGALVPVMPEQRLGGFCAGRGEQRRTEVGAERAAARIPGQMLLELEERGALGEVLLDQHTVAADDARAIVLRRRRRAKDPWRPQGPAADHDRGAPGRALHGQ